MIRLDKLLSELKIGTRSEVKVLLKKKLIKINDQIVTDPSSKVDENTCTVSYNDKVYHYKKYTYYMLNKPAGVISATNDDQDKTVIDLLNDFTGMRLNDDYFPVGRLDKDTVGLLLLTNDGELAHKLLSPKYHVDKKYYVRLLNKISSKDVEKVEQGIELKDFKTAKSKVDLINDYELFITITEGKYHEIKRIFGSLNNKVIYLKRVSFGNIELDNNLKEGEIRELSDEEINLLKG